MYKVMKNKEIPIYADNEQIGVGIYPFVSSCAFSEDPNTSYQFDGNRLLLFASKTISKGEPLTVSMNILINSSFHSVVVRIQHVFGISSCEKWLRYRLFHERYMEYSIVDEEKNRPGYLMGLLCPHGHRIQPQSVERKSWIVS